MKLLTLDHDMQRRLGDGPWPETRFTIRSCPSPLGRTSEYTHHGHRVRARTVQGVRIALEARGCPLPADGLLHGGYRMFTGDVTGFHYWAAGRFYRIDADADLPAKRERR